MSRSWLIISARVGVCTRDFSPVAVSRSFTNQGMDFCSLCYSIDKNRHNVTVHHKLVLAFPFAQNLIVFGLPNHSIANRSQDWLIPAMNWTSLVFGSTANFLVPLALYLYSRANPITEHPTTQLANMKSGSPSSTGSSQEISAPVSRPTGSEANVEANLEPQGSSPTLPGLSPAEKKILPLPQPNRHLPYPRNLEAEEEGIFMATNSRAFKAFPERLWWCTKVVASITLGLMLCAVLGSIILK